MKTKVRRSNPRSQWWLLTQDNPSAGWRMALLDAVGADSNGISESSGVTAVLAVESESPKKKDHVHVIVVFAAMVYRSQVKRMFADVGRLHAKPLRRDFDEYDRPIRYVTAHIKRSTCRNAAPVIIPNAFWSKYL